MAGAEEEANDAEAGGFTARVVRGSGVALGALLNRIAKTSVSPNTDARGKHPSVVSCVSLIWGGGQ